jgi:hypothetical protein
MKQFLLQAVLDPKTKSTDSEFVDLKNAIQKTAKDQGTKASVKLMRDGNATLRVDDDATADLIVEMLQQLPNVSVSGISSPLEAYVQQRANRSAQKK